MDCIYCAGHMKESTCQIRLINANDKFTRIEGIPCRICKNCDEDYFTKTTRLFLSNIIGQIRDGYITKTVINYSKLTCTKVS